MPPSDSPSLDDWVRLTQHYQSHVLKVQIETLRRLKYRPTGGFCFARLADPVPAISAAVLDHERHPKAAHAVVAAACAPLIVVADQLAETTVWGEKIQAAVHVVNDLRQEFDEAIVDAHVEWPGGSEDFRFGGPVPVDEVVLVGSIVLDAPEIRGELTLDLTLHAGDRTAHNHYRTALAPPTP